MNMKRWAATFIVALGLAASMSAARADEQADTAAHRQLENLKQYGASHKACDGWTDGCALCARRDDGSLGCSRMGVDCDVSAIQCTQLARDPKTGKTPAPPQ